MACAADMCFDRRWDCGGILMAEKDFEEQEVNGKKAILLLNKLTKMI